MVYSIGMGMGGVALTGVQCVTNQQITSLVVNERTSPEFVYYDLSQRRGELRQLASGGSAQLILTKRGLSHVPIRLPPYPKQCAIASILGCLDDKIELNRRMNQNLEQIAQALFKSWFVDFDPVRAKAEGRWKKGESLLGMPADSWSLWPSEFEESEIGEIPKGWGVGALQDLAEVMQGGTPSTSAPDYWNPPEVDWVTVKDLSAASHHVLLSTERSLSRAGLAKIGSEIAPRGTILLSTGAPIGYFALSAIPMALGTRVAAIQARGETGTQYLLRWVASSTEALRDAANGTTFPQLLLSTLREFPLAIPPQELLSAFDKHLSPIQNRLIAAGHESATLASTRDALLPKLLSGEIRVPPDGGR
jgi:type I restriction enzyme, S subunit